MPSPPIPDVGQIRVIRGSRPYVSIDTVGDGKSHTTKRPVADEVVRTVQLPSGKPGGDTMPLRITSNHVNQPPNRETHQIKGYAGKIVEGLSEDDLKYLRTCSVLIGTPCYGGNATINYMKSLNATRIVMQEIGITMQEHFISAESLIPRGRNGIAASFHESGFTHLLFIDADIGWEPIAVIRLLLARRELISGVYPLKMYDWEQIFRYCREYDTERQGPFDSHKMLLQCARYVCNFANPEVAIEDGMYLELREAPTGFMLMSKECVQRLIRHIGHQTYYVNDVSSYDNEVSANSFYDLFQCIIDEQTGRYLSEDYGFSILVKKAGMKVYGDPMARLTHSGVHTFPGQLAAKLAYTQPPGEKRDRWLSELGMVPTKPGDK